jgi:hypothetical protein
LYATTLAMSRYNGERRREDNEHERVLPGRSVVPVLIENGVLPDELVVSESTRADGNTVAKAWPAVRRMAIDKGLAVPRMTSYAAFSAA